MRAEIISIGSEITTGQNLDTNCQWLSLRLAELGVSVAFHTTVADDLADNIAAFRIASERVDLVLTTGGLGPTQDDLTREALASVAGVPLQEDAQSLAHIRAMFAARNREMPERNRVQALMPAGSEVLFNARGTAPGVWMKINRAYFAAMPGVPSEMFTMFTEQVVPRMRAAGLLGQGSVILQRKINCFGAGESVIEEKVLDLTRRGHVPEVGITVSDAVISLRIFGRGPTQADALAQIAPVEATIRQRLGDLVYGVDDEELQQVVERLLRQRGLTLATAESVTGGLVAHRLTSVPGASEVFRGGIVAYTNPAKVQLLGVPAALIETHGAVSSQVAEAMAQGARQRLGSDLAVSTTGLAGPGTEGEKPVGLVYVGLAWAEGVRSLAINWGGTRAEILSRSAKSALNAVRLFLLNG
jgi:nicotinamide-nucleotide amidase